MPFLRALVQIPRDTQDSADTVTNTWHFDVDNGTAAAAAAEVHSALTTFYQAIDTYMPSALVETPATVDYYDLEESEPRVPVHTATIALTTTASTDYLPPEVCATLSFQGASGSGVNMRRRRGRLYLGPFHGGIFTTTSGRIVFTTAFVDAIVAAAQSVLNYTGTLGVSWAVFSPTTYAETGNLGTAFEDVTDGWVDNEPDIQRRRGGGRALTRTTFT